MQIFKQIYFNKLKTGLTNYIFMDKKGWKIILLRLQVSHNDSILETTLSQNEIKVFKLVIL